MSDSEEMNYVRPEKVVHYGSLEDAERARLEVENTTDNMDVDHDGVNQNIKTISSETRTSASEGILLNLCIKILIIPCVSVSVLMFIIFYTLPVAISVEEYVPIEKQAALDELERKKRARLMGITTDDNEVRKHLRHLGEPITLFGEGPADRRNRLKELLSYYGTEAIEKKKEDEKEGKVDKDQTETTWYHEGPDSLQAARLWLAHYSLPRAKQRLADAKLELEIPESSRTAKRFRFIMWFDFPT